MHPHPRELTDPCALNLFLSNTNTIKQIGLELGFQQVGICDTRLDQQHAHYAEWIARHYHGEMGYMARNLDKRLNPALLVPNTLCVICVRLDYLVEEQREPMDLLDHADLAYLSRYALGRDYHKLMRKRLQKFAERIREVCGDMGYRVFTDSAPVLEKALAVKAGLGWQGKHSNVLHRRGSWFFLGEIFTDMPLEPDSPRADHCGRCRSCIDVCPTGAIVEPYVVDARRCISYLTIEHRSPIPVEFRAAIGNRIYGCDDCQLVCPWNRFADYTREADFRPRHGLDRISLLDCFGWSEEEFLRNTEGSAIRRIGYQCWLRNVAIALGNAAPDPHIIATLRRGYGGYSDLVRQHVDWAIEQQLQKQAGNPAEVRDS
jgi:epoxyqueuosine reductase